MTTFAGHLLGPDTHANRPAATAVPEGTLYSCSDHDIVYQSDGSTWANWAVLDADGSATTETLTNKTIDSFTNDVDADAVHVEVWNATGSVITKGTPVYVSGANVAEVLPEVAPADATDLSTMPAIGIVEADIADGAAGAVNRIGRLSGLDTDAYGIGDLLYVSETAGELTGTRPTAPAISQQVAKVLWSSATVGVLDLFAADALIPASESAVGGVEIATQAEVDTGTDTLRSITPATLAGVETVKSGSGATGSRPAGATVGERWFDTTLGQPIWWDGTQWVDATGTAA